MENIRTTSNTYPTTSAIPSVVTLLARIMALPAGYKHRAELESLTPEMRTDFNMTDSEHKAALDIRVTALPEYKIKCAKWEERIMRAIFKTGIRM